ncbi:hypothetical protein KGA66_16805 [Actinocrinis puniceicyclus]|uniref:Cellulase (Glycosyl hydrolase family 5) n=1 Tax=Actinocrinis puniceicyclus TaxID=977794 RepID=A0A8J8BDQ4_9ACTN|nr:hypothetical protein [Actinocrinis puniceicyclus]MBS2964720.1 hypothetical protein [Actinocrinis puniceicyclus]
MRRRGLRLRIGLTAAVITVIAALMSAAAPSGPSPAAGCGNAGSRSSALSRYLRTLRLMNYFPSDAGWQYMWTRWEPDRIDHDFAVMATMGVNTVRITVFPDVMGFPTPSAAMRSRLAQILGMAGAHGLKVQLSLFDQFTDFADIPDSLTWAHDLLEPLAGSSRQIGFIDLRNEIDAPATMDDPAVHRPQVYRWLDALLPAVRHDAHGVPVALSVTEPAHISALRVALRVEPDFWDLHYYSSDALAYATMDEAIQAAAPRPVFVGETGFATAADGSPPGLPAAAPSLEAYQAHYYQVIEQAALSLCLGPAAPWALYDFTRAAIPSRQQPDQYAFGLLDTDGKPKPAAAVIRRIFHGASIGDDFNGDFSQAVTTPRGELPAVWRLWEPDQARFALDPARGHETPGSARISDSGGSAEGMPAFYTVPVQPQTVPGYRYRVTAWVRGQAATGTTVVNVSWFDSRGVFISGCDSAALDPGDTDWTELEATGTAPPAAAFAEIWLKSAHNSGAVWFDDVTWTRWAA